MKKLEYVTTGTASNKYMSVEMLFENLIKEVVPPARFIIADYNMPEMMGSEMCMHIRNHFEALVSKLVNNQDVIPDFSDI
jgi:CheY-like chemotaxis protein